MTSKQASGSEKSAKTDVLDDKVPGGAYSDKIHARFWVAGEKGGYLGVGRVELLEKIEVSGSMNKAAKEMGMSYKKAWKLVDELNQMYDQPLVVKAQGGRAGGGSVLTDRGREVIDNFRCFERRFSEFLRIESGKLKI